MTTSLPALEYKTAGYAAASGLVPVTVDWGRGVERKGAKARSEALGNNSSGGTSGSGANAACAPSEPVSGTGNSYPAEDGAGNSMEGHSITPPSSSARGCMTGAAAWDCAAGTSLGGRVDAPTASSEGNTSAAPTGRAPSTKKAGTTGSGTCKTEGTGGGAAGGGGDCTGGSWAATAPAESLGAVVEADTGRSGREAASASRAGADSGAPQSRSPGSARRTGAGGGRRRSSAMSGSKGAGAVACRWAEASNTCWQLPQRTHPSEMRNWSATTLNRVPQDGQRVVWLMGCGL